MAKKGLSFLYHARAILVYINTSFVLQLISLAGLHVNAVSMGKHCLSPRVFAPSDVPLPKAELSAQYEQDGMLAYVNLVQRKEKELNCDVLTHQKWYVSSLSSQLLSDLLTCFL